MLLAAFQLQNSLICKTIRLLSLSPGNIFIIITIIIIVIVIVIFIIMIIIITIIYRSRVSAPQNSFFTLIYAVSLLKGHTIYNNNNNNNSDNNDDHNNNNNNNNNSNRRIPYH